MPSSDNTHKKRSHSKSRKSQKFIPNLTQIQNATKGLPDAEECIEDTFTYFFVVDHQQKTIKFKKISLQRGDNQTARWIYEGKVLVRNRDIEAL